MVRHRLYSTVVPCATVVVGPDLGRLHGTAAAATTSNGVNAPDTGEDPMRTVWTLLALATLSLALAACAQAGDSDSAANEEGAAMTEDAGETTITGALAGDPELEGGCVWLETEEARYEVLWPDGWEADTDPIELRNPEGDVVAREGDELRVTGQQADDVATTCQVGTIFEASAVESS